MGQQPNWQRKLDPYGRLYVEEGLPAAGVDVTIRLTGPDAQAASSLKEAGLQLHAQVGEIVAGRVAHLAHLRAVAELPCVQEVQMSRPLYEGSAESMETESHNE